jgi:Fe-S oxidoreductase
LGLFNRLRGNILYYPGCLTRFFLSDKLVNYEAILKKLGIEFIRIKDLELCCGIPALQAGYTKDYENLMSENKALFKNQGVTKIITNCPTCFWAFNNKYGIKTEHITQTIFKNIDKLEKRYDEKITYHDPCDLGRKSDVYSQPREILEALGFEIVEMKHSKAISLCCGGRGGLRMNAPKIANKIAELRLKEVKTKKLITTCPMCYRQLKDNAEGIEILKFSELVI